MLHYRKGSVCLVAGDFELDPYSTHRYKLTFFGRNRETATVLLYWIHSAHRHWPIRIPVDMFMPAGPRRRARELNRRNVAQDRLAPPLAAGLEAAGALRILVPKPGGERDVESLDSRVVLDDHLTSTCQELLGKWTGLARFQIEVNCGQHGDSGDLTGLLIRHLVEKPDDLISHLQNPGSNGDDVPGAQLPLVRNVLLYARHPAIVLAQERGSKAQLPEHMPGGLVKLADVPHHVHVSHMVALPGIDRATISDRQFNRGRSEEPKALRRSFSYSISRFAVETFFRGE